MIPPPFRLSSLVPVNVPFAPDEPHEPPVDVYSMPVTFGDTVMLLVPTLAKPTEVPDCSPTVTVQSEVPNNVGVIVIGPRCGPCRSL